MYESELQNKKHDLPKISIHDAITIDFTPHCENADCSMR
jgi:hypothetical protein